MFISRIRIQGLRRIGDVSIELGSLSLFVGADSLTILDAVSLLSCASRGAVDPHALDRTRHGRRCALRVGDRIVLEATLGRAVYCVELESTERSLEFVRETLIEGGSICAQRAGRDAWVSADRKMITLDLAEDSGFAQLVYALRPRDHGSVMLKMLGDYRTYQARHHASCESPFAPAAHALAELASHRTPRVVGLYGVDRMPGLVGIVREVAAMHRERQILWATHRADVANAFMNEPTSSIFWMHDSSARND